jgi:chemotaxis protein methyltransferase CheR
VSQSLELLAALIRRETGISIKPAQYPSLAAAVRRVDPALDAAAFLRADGRSDRSELLDRLIDEVTVNETFFFRQRRELDALDWGRLLAGARARGDESVRVWVAACSTGEEAYTLAILASQVFAQPRPPVSILATDISAAVLDKAREARYGRRALRTLDRATRDRYFVPAGDGIAVATPVRDLVEFRRHNLVSDAPPVGGPAFDLIACRNVLIYFDGGTVERVIGLLERGLAPGGTLLLGAADRLCGSATRIAPRADKGEAPPPRARPPARALRAPLGRAPAPEPQVPLDARSYFLQGLSELSQSEPGDAVASLRRALYVDPTFGLAAFQLGRAHEECGNRAAARRAYEQALRTLDPDDPRYRDMLDQVDLGDVAAACALRLGALRETA